jgi:DNA-binding CsgD family transcriptional regulator
MASTNPLSKREQDVVRLLLQGKSNKQLAIALGISESTVEFHLKNIYAKLKVSSRTELILKLGESTGPSAGELGESTVVEDKNLVHNGISERTSTQVSPATPPEVRSGTQGIGRILWKYKILILIGLFLAIVGVIVLRRPMPWEGYARECERPDESTVGQMISRSNASGKEVHGQFGTTGSPPWPARSGYVLYKNIRIPSLDQSYLLLRYSKNTPSSVPILVTLDGETSARATIYPVDQHDWDQFSWTQPIPLGRIEGGVHSIQLSTDGQQYGVADLDRLILTDRPP